MREITDVNPQPTTELEILWHGINELATMETGSHIDNPEYAARREASDYAKRIKSAAKAAPSSSLTARQKADLSMAAMDNADRKARFSHGC